MEKTSSLNLLDSSSDSLELFNAFLPDFYEYLRNKPESVDLLLRLQKNGNKKATEIITYLIMGTPSALSAASPSMQLKGKLFRGITYNYELSWSDFKIDGLGQDQPRLTFSFQAIFDQEEHIGRISGHILTARKGYAKNPFRYKFLLKVVSEWLKENGFKMYGLDLEKNNGMLHPYVKVSLDFINRIPDPERPNRNDLGTTKYVRGFCSIRIEQLR